MSLKRPFRLVFSPHRTQVHVDKLKAVLRDLRVEFADEDLLALTRK